VFEKEMLSRMFVPKNEDVVGIGVVWIELTQDKFQGRAVTSVIMNLYVS
jgi:hypothetical protein